MIKSEILNILRNSDSHVSGQYLCDRLGVSRTAVWKVINQLKDEGYVIEAIQNKGYRIEAFPDVVTDTEIESLICDIDGIITNVVNRESTDSTNNEAKRNADKAENGTLFITERQTDGRGRRGKTWISTEGDGIWMSLFLKEPDIAPQKASMLTIVAAMAVAKAVAKAASEVVGKTAVGDTAKASSEIECMIKWPNDIVLGGRKICGILTEMSAETDYVHYVVIGIGINVNTENFDDAIKNMATSIYNETAQRIKRSVIIAYFSEYFKKYYDIFIKDGSLKGFKEEYNALLINRGREVMMSLDEAEYMGVAVGINDNGELVVQCADGTTKEIRAGEVSVRGLYGYV